MKYPLHRFIYTIFGLFFLSFLFISFSSNGPNGNTGAPGESTCTSCHGGNNSLGLDGDIQILGVPADILPGTTYPLSVIVSNPNGISLTAGFSMTALDAAGNTTGLLTNPSFGSSVQVGGFRDYFRHTPAQPYAANRTVTWTVDWTAPATSSPDQITFYAAGNITDNSPGTNTANDLIVTTTAAGTIGGTPTGSDLTISNLVGWDATYMPGEVVSFDFDINNIGNATAVGDYNITSYLSTDAFFDASDISVGDLVTGNTSVGSIPSVVGAISIPANLSPGNYFLIIVIDAFSAINELDESNNIFVSQVASTIQPSVALTGSWSASDASCFGNNNGSATASASGGTAPYMYAWQNGMTTQTISGLAAGNYPFMITDANNNNFNGIATVNEPTQLVATVTTVDVQCANNANGSANASITGGTPPYSIDYPGGVNSNLSAGNYIVTITDGNGCSTTENYTINANDDTPPSVVLDQATVVSLDGNGQATIPDAIFDDNSTDNCGGNLVFSASQVNFTCADLGSQNINLQVTDDSGNSVTVTAVAMIVDNISPIVICPSVNAVGCGSAINYSLPVATDNCSQNIVPTLLSGLPSGASFPVGTTQVIYEAADASGNTATCFFDVTIPGNTLVNQIAATNTSCFGATDGSATAVVSGGSGPYQYNWNTMQTGSMISNLAAGTYMVTVTDANQCELITSVEVGSAAAIIIGIDLISDDTGGGNGFIFVTASGGAGGYSYNWFDANNTLISTAEDPQDLMEGLYNVVVTDANGCTETSLQVQIGSTVVDVDEINFEKSIQIFPNPSTGFLTINMDTNPGENIDLEIMDQHGKLVYNISNLESLNQLIDLNHLQNGLYWCKFRIDETIAVKKIIIAK